MNQIIIYPHEFNSEQTVLLNKGLRLTHIQQVLKAKVGSTLKIAHLNVGIGLAQIRTLQEDYCELDVIQMEKMQKNSWCHLIVGLSRPPTIKKILEHGTSMGVGSFHFIPTQLTEKAYSQSKIFQNQEFEKSLHLGLSQSAHYFQLPQVHLYPRFSEFCKNFFTQDLIKRPNKWILDLTSDRYFSQYPYSPTKEVTLCIGPERGWLQDELQTFAEAGFASVKVSAATLRVEMSAFYSLAQLELLRKAPSISNNLTLVSTPP